GVARFLGTWAGTCAPIARPAGRPSPSAGQRGPGTRFDRARPRDRGRAPGRARRRPIIELSRGSWSTGRARPAREGACPSPAERSARAAVASVPPYGKAWNGDGETLGRACGEGGGGDGG